MPVAIPLIVSLAVGALAGGGGPAAIAAGTFSIGGALVGAAIGAAVGAIGLLGQKKPNTGRKTQDTISTTSIRTLPVPVVFGRGRLGGNYIALGNFLSYATGKDDGRARLVLLHAIIGLSEGPIQTIGNYRFDTRRKADALQLAVKAHNTSESEYFITKLYNGRNNEGLLPMVTNSGEPVALGFAEDVGGVWLDITSHEPAVPWRNTARISLQAFCGYTPRLVDFGCDAVGQDFTLRRSGTTSGSNFHDAVGYAYYDADSECFFYTLTSSDTASPRGLVRISRSGASGRQHTAPPLGVSSDIIFGWYLGRHDVVVMQDPSDSSLFHVAYWGATNGSPDWEHYTPDPGYVNPIKAEYLDERHGILHTLHNGSDGRYVMRWWLGTGRIEKMLIDFPEPNYKAFCYSPDFHAYILVTVAGHVLMADADSGETFRDTTNVNVGGCIGVCATGNRIGVIKTDSFVYWDPQEGTTEVLGSNDNSLNEGCFGSTVSARQNSWTGHVTIAKPYTGSTAALVNFIPSVIEDLEDVSANGTPTEPEFQWQFPIWVVGHSYTTGDYVQSDGVWAPWHTGTQYVIGDLVTGDDGMRYRCIADHQASAINAPGTDPILGVNESGGANFWVRDNGSGYKNYVATATAVSTYSNGPGLAGAGWDLYDLVMPQANSVKDWVRDWSYRTYNAYNLVQLEGNSSVAAAAWAAMVDDVNLDSGRWGAGLQASLFCLSSFESVHSHCVGGVRMQNPRKVKKHPDGTTTLPAISYRYAERFKFDFVLDNEIPVAELVTNEILASINGYQYMADGRYYVGIQKPGIFPSWLFNEGNMVDGAAAVTFQGRGTGINRIRVQYTNVRDEYRKDIVQADNEFDQNSRYHVQMSTLSFNGISRNGHAEIIARGVLDQVHANRRSVELKTHFLGLAFTPGDCIEISHVGCGLSRVKSRIVSSQEDERGDIKFSAQEHRPVLSLLRDTDTGNPNDPGDSIPTDPTVPGACESAVGGTGSDVVWFNSGGVYAPGNYFLYYIDGAYQLNPHGGWTVKGYDVVTKDGAGNIVVLQPAPSFDDPDTGYSSAAIAEEANSGQNATLALAAAGPVGIRLRSPAYDNTGAEGNPEYDLCLEKKACDDCDQCDEGCTEPANCGNFWFAPTSVLRVPYAITLNGAVPILPAVDQLDLPMLEATTVTATWQADLGGGQTITAKFDAILLTMDIDYQKDGGRWHFFGRFGFDGSAIALIPESSIWGSAEGDPVGSATPRLLANPNPKDGKDCFSAKPCCPKPPCDGNDKCLKVSARYQDATVVYFGDGANFAAGTYSVEWVSGVITFSQGVQGYRLHVGDHRYFVRYKTAGDIDADLALKPDSEVEYPTDLDAQEAYRTTLTEADKTVTFVHTGGKIGVWLQDDPYPDNRPGPVTGNPVFRLCAVDDQTSCDAPTCCNFFVVRWKVGGFQRERILARGVTNILGYRMMPVVNAAETSWGAFPPGIYGITWIGGAQALDFNLPGPYWFPAFGGSISGGVNISVTAEADPDFPVTFPLGPGAPGFTSSGAAESAPKDPATWTGGGGAGSFDPTDGGDGGNHAVLVFRTFRTGEIKLRMDTAGGDYTANLVTGSTPPNFKLMQPVLSGCLWLGIFEDNCKIFFDDVSGKWRLQIYEDGKATIFEAANVGLCAPDGTVGTGEWVIVSDGISIDADSMTLAAQGTLNSYTDLCTT